MRRIHQALLHPAREASVLPHAGMVQKVGQGGFDLAVDVQQAIFIRAGRLRCEAGQRVRGDG